MASTTNNVAPILSVKEDLALACKVNEDSIDFLTRQIKAAEATIEEKVELREPYTKLLSMEWAKFWDSPSCSRRAH